MRRFFKKLTFICALSIIAIFLLVIIINWHVNHATQDKTFDEIDHIPTNHVGLVLGTAKYLQDGRDNVYYTYRMDATVALFEAGKINYVLVSGDNGTTEYDEPNMMREDLIERGIPKERIYLDYAGFRTLDSVVRSKEIFGQEQLTIISQPFHTKRAVYIAKSKDIDAIGYNAKDVHPYYSLWTQTREKLARVKMVMDLIFGKKAKFYGDPIDIPVSETSAAYTPPTGYTRTTLTRQVDGNRQEVGYLFLMSGLEAKLDIITKATNEETAYLYPTMDAEGLAQRYIDQQKQPVLQLAGAFTHDWEHIQGMAFDDGVLIGALETKQWDGLLVIEDGIPHIEHKADIKHLDSFLDNAVEKELSIIEQISIIRDGEIDIYPPFPPDRLYTFRFFVEYQIAEKIFPGVIIFTEAMSVEDSMAVIDSLNTDETKILNALYLDGGSVSTGVYYDALQTPFEFTDPGFGHKEDGYTNVLLFFSE
ncbi:YdcF family protein [Patescibacteria group bacterium]|nr:YdcF family protein [Patescibacteria group bacterium]MBU1721947.1 YdcF family protein [Patescibacteria group bacterium]MBU1901768.1 YdcF family protein [Patescibacteria group bacterium]